MIALFFDTETTGFKTPSFTPEIVQIGAILQDTTNGRVLGELNILCQAENPIPEVCTAIHGITDELATKFGVKSEAADRMFGLLARSADVVIAHNIEFDIGIIDGVWPVSREIVRSKPKFCTMRGCAPVQDIPRKHAAKRQYAKLVDAYRYFYQQEFDNAHDAMADVRACRDVFTALLEHEWYVIDSSDMVMPTVKNLEALRT